MIWIHQNPWRVEADTWTDEGVKHLSVEVGSLSEAITIEENWLADTLPLARWSGRGWTGQKP